MWWMARALRGEGYRVWNETYPSTRLPVEAMSAPHIDAGLAACREAGGEVIHFVTHSLGGIMIRHYLQDHAIAELGHIVMLAPPNQGSEVTDYLRDKWYYRMATGPAGQQLGTDADSLPNRLGRVDASIGVIAGRRSSDPWFSSRLPGEDDGKVAVERTRLAEMRDFRVVDAGHTFIMNKPEVIGHTLHFLAKGRFGGGADGPAAVGNGAARQRK